MADIVAKELSYRVEVENILRPITTIGYKKEWQSESYDFPKLYDVPPTFPVMLYTPESSYANDRNERFNQRYANFNNLLY